jgi:arylamine N-acetyltransferase
VREYLTFLGLDGPVPLTLDGLTALTRAHLRRVLFESVTSILRRAAHPDGLVPDLDTQSLLQSWIDRRGGGVCYEITAVFGEMLRELGFTVRQINATISWPGSHQALVVNLDQQQLLVDVGNGAPFSEPIPLDGTAEVHHAGLAYRFRPGEASSSWIQDRWIDEAWVPFCTYDLRPADLQVRETAYQHHHTIGQSWVVDNLVLTRCTAEEVWTLRDDLLRHFTADRKSAQQITDPEDYVRLASDVFDMPKLPIERARRILLARNAPPARLQR